MLLLKVQPSTAEMASKARLYYACTNCSGTACDVYADLHDRPGTYYCQTCIDHSELPK